MAYAYIGLGSNRGSAHRHLQQAARRLRRLRGGHLTALSPFYHSAPVGCMGRQPAYCNAVAEIQTLIPPQRLFKQLRQVEHAIQKRKRMQNMPRILDVDYLAHGFTRLRSARLTLPHPRIYQRAFILQPLHDLLGLARQPRPLEQKIIKQALHKQRHQSLQLLTDHVHPARHR